MPAVGGGRCLKFVSWRCGSGERSYPRTYGDLPQFTQWPWIDHPTFHLSGGPFHWPTTATDWNSLHTCVCCKYMKDALDNRSKCFVSLTKHIHFKGHKQENKNPIYTTYLEPDQETKSKVISVYVDEANCKCNWNYFWQNFAPNMNLCLARRPQPKLKQAKLFI